MGFVPLSGQLAQTDCSEIIHSTDSPRANPYFLPLIYRGLTRFRRSYLNSQFMLFFRNNYPSWKTSTAGIYNFWLPRFLIREYMGWNGKKYFPHLGRKSQPFMLLIHRSLNYTQFKCLNGIEDSLWSFYDSATGTCIAHQNFAFVWFMPGTILFGSMIFTSLQAKTLGF